VVRNPRTQRKARLQEVENLIKSFDLQKARAQTDELRAEIGPHPDLVRLSARIDRLAEKSR
jgi:hypothetical protein